MNKILKNQVCKLAPGTLISGKWHHRTYRIVRLLGIGATGVVYLVEDHTGVHVALKISFTNASVTSEVNVLKHFSKVHGKVLGPSLIDVDDWRMSYQSEVLSFYVMEYVKGESFLSFVSSRGIEWMPVLTMQLLKSLGELHQSGWTFGDLKPDNLIVTPTPVQVRWLDVGGTTLHGRSIKEFTDFYDRGYWGLGTRQAQASYDLFAVGMIMINAVYPKRFKKTEGGIAQLKKMIGAKAELKPYEKVLHKALTGKYANAEEMRQDLLYITTHQDKKDSSYRVNIQSSKAPSKTRQTKHKKKKRSRFLETITLFVSVTLIYLLYLWIQVL
ncbi:protein kinase domain-containing protein [Priestia koreensis]|uniref:protein kinase domain-containing protein n=1 Tax=Priestia koreensis TaxID=284581 RepID=UPI00203C529F|nr:protein kinase family protein [Priestia koreensis]MCM3006924.1 protein kinase family protein [Priestia koreensis]